MRACLGLPTHHVHNTLLLFRPTLVVRRKISSSVASTHLPSTSHSMPMGVMGSRVWMVGWEAMRDTNLVNTSSTLSTVLEMKEENSSSAMAWASLVVGAEPSAKDSAQRRKTRRKH